MTTKKKILIVAVVLALILVILLVSLFLLGVGVKAGKEGIVADAPFFETTINTEDIRKIELYEGISYGEKTGGMSFLGVTTGKCKNAAFGTYVACVHNSNTTCVAVLKSDGFYTVFNLENAEKTIELYEKLLTLYQLN